MFGKNKITKPSFGDGSVLAIKEVFATLQGEGPFAGEPSVFVRLGGCNLQCKFCDTDFDNPVDMSLEQLLFDIKQFSFNGTKQVIKLVVITGGEPLLQPIENLCDKLIAQGYKVQIETNGTICREINTDVFIICSPKAGINGYSLVRDDMLARVSALKFIVSKSNHLYDNVPENKEYQEKEIYIQPMDELDEEKNKENLKYCVDLCLEKGYKLSMQLHKIIGIR
jgi:7-carboxy-7-deazaguanine synthase